MKRALGTCLVVVALALGPMPGCGGGGGGGGVGTPSPSPAPSPSPTPPSTNPCPTNLVAGEPASAARASRRAAKRAGVFGDTGWTWLDGVWAHRAARERALALGLAVEPPEVARALDVDAGDIAVLQDGGDLILPVNALDLRGRGLRFSPGAGGGYDVAAIDATFRGTLGTRVTLEDDDSSRAAIPFPFGFYGSSHTAAFVNSDGNITFGEGDSASTPRNVTRLLQGPPRVATFLADLDPSAGGQVYLNAAADAFTVTFCGVRGFDSDLTATLQTTLLPDGTIEMAFDTSVSLTGAIVGLSPGRTTRFSPVDLTATPLSVTEGALAERFAGSPELDLVAVSRRFLASHPDAFDQLVIWTDTRVVTDAFAFETTVRNDIQGLGLQTFDESAAYGASGRLSSLVLMDRLPKYPDDPQQKFLGENSTVSVIGQETGHRWLVFFRIRDRDGSASAALLGRDEAHWGFFVDSDASVMEGNDIEDLGNGSFRTVGAVSRFSLLDQYAMGLAGESEVPPFFYVEGPTGTSPPVDGPDDAPRIGVTFRGTRRDVALADIVAAMGARRPSADQAPKSWRQAFVYVVGAGRQADPAQVAKLDRIRGAWEGFYREATDGRGQVETRLR